MNKIYTRTIVYSLLTIFIILCLWFLFNIYTDQNSSSEESISKFSISQETTQNITPENPPDTEFGIPSEYLNAPLISRSYYRDIYNDEYEKKYFITNTFTATGTLVSLYYTYDPLSFIDPSYHFPPNLQNYQLVSSLSLNLKNGSKDLAEGLRKLIPIGLDKNLLILIETDFEFTPSPCQDLWLSPQLFSIDTKSSSLQMSNYALPSEYLSGIKMLSYNCEQKL